jgi:hypothetical protein
MMGPGETIGAYRVLRKLGEGGPPSLARELLGASSGEVSPQPSARGPDGAW